MAYPQDVHIETIDFTRRIATSSEGHIGRINLMLDSAGEETDDVSLADVIVIQLEHDAWVVVPLSDFEKILVH